MISVLGSLQDKADAGTEGQEVWVYVSETLFQGKLIGKNTFLESVLSQDDKENLGTDRGVSDCIYLELSIKPPKADRLRMLCIKKNDISAWGVS